MSDSKWISQQSIEIQKKNTVSGKKWLITDGQTNEIGSRNVPKGGEDIPVQLPSDMNKNLKNVKWKEII